MRYRFIDVHRGRWPVRAMCRTLRVSPGGCYGWRGRPASPASRRRAALVAAIRAVHGEVKARYGSPRVHAELVATGGRCSVNTVAKLMREQGIAARARACYELPPVILANRRPTKATQCHPVKVSFNRS